MKKHVFYTEAAYFLGLCLLALGTALMALGDFGISMVTAPAYVLYLKISQLLPFFSFGMAEYILEVLVLLGMMLTVRQIKARYFLCLVTAAVFGLLLDGAMALTGLLPVCGIWGKLILYVLGFLLCACAISLILRAYLPPAAYELFVKEIAAKKGISFPVVKTVYDCCSLLVAVVLSLLFFGTLRGIGIGTVIGAFLNDLCIRMFTAVFDKLFVFHDLKKKKARTQYE